MTPFFRRLGIIGAALGLFVIVGPGLSVFTTQKTSLQRWRADFARPETVPYPTHNPYTAEKASLGEDLFFDPRLSRLQRMSCARCHNPELGLEDGIPVAEGENGLLVDRNTQTVWNLAWTEPLFWDGRVQTLEDQVKHPITEPREMNFSFEGVIERLSLDAEMVESFRAAFPERDRITAQSIEEALATYQRGLISPPTRFDQWVEGDDAALSEAEERGLALFVGRAGCVQCHSGWRFTDDQFRDVGVGNHDKGRFEVTGDKRDLYAFRTPGLREITKRAPYMHDGSLKTLDDVIRHHTSGFVRRSSVDPVLKPVELSDAEIGHLTAFLGTLSATQEAIDAALAAE